MLQYLLNTTAIWLLSLLMYDPLLRRENFHNFNRFYLVFTLLLGALFPLIEWSSAATIYNGNATIQQVATVKQNIVSSAPLAAANFDLAKWFWGIYFTGVAVSIILLIIEIITLLVFYTKGARHVEDFTVIETNKPHAPFSLFNMLFVESKKQYSDTEWQMICLHERQHNHLLHFADLLLLQFSRIVFWFHPLVYMYSRRLLMIHEYQADKVAKNAPEQYGRFLIEQAILKSAPVISHSFNRSPIKNRIVMLTKNTSRAARIKTLVFIPVILTCMVCFAQNGKDHKRQRNGDVITFMGHKFELSKALPPDTVMTQDPTTGKMQMILARITQHPVKMDGKEIYSIEKVSQAPTLKTPEQSLRELLLNRLHSELSQLPDGKYYMLVSYIITDAKGAIVYYDFDGINPAGGPFTSKSAAIPAALQKEINSKVEKVIDEIKVNPAINNGQKVLCLTNSGKVFDSSTPIVVKDHTASWTDHF